MTTDYQLETDQGVVSLINHVVKTMKPSGEKIPAATLALFAQVIATIEKVGTNDAKSAMAGVRRAVGLPAKAVTKQAPKNQESIL